MEQLTELGRRYLAAVCIQRQFCRCRLLLRAKQHLPSLILLQVVNIISINVAYIAPVC